MPERVRQGLVENAGGDLRCPHKGCGLSVSLRQVVVATKPYTVYVDQLRSNTVASDGGLLASSMAVVVYLGCGEGHLTHIAMETTEQGTHTETWWDDTPEPKEGELR
jgi:hypothetical protein